MSNLEKVYSELTEIFYDVYSEYEDALEDNEYPKERYWQGKKDGVRIALALLSPLVDENKFWELQRDSSLGSRSTKLEQAKSLLDEAHYLSETVLKKVEYPHPWYVPFSNLARWIEQSGILED